MRFRERLGEARPARTAFELGAAVEQWQAAQPASERAWPLFVKEGAAERRFGAVFEQDVLLLITEARNEVLELFVGRRCQIEGGLRGSSHESSLRLLPNMG